MLVSLHLEKGWLHSASALLEASFLI
jgi:hypothetical protein